MSSADITRSLSRQGSSGVHSPATQSGGYASTFRDPAAGYEQPPSKHHKLLYDERPSDSAYQYFQRSSQGTSSQQFNPYPYNPSREVLSSNRPSLYSQDSQLATAYPSEYSYSHQRMESSNVSSPTVPQAGAWSGFPQAPRCASMQYPSREMTGQYLYGQGVPLQSRQPPQYLQPVPPERQLSSSITAQQGYDRSSGQLERQASYTTSTRYTPNYDDRRGTYPLSQSFTMPQDTYSQLLPRTLPPPLQSSGVLASTGSTTPSAYSYSTIQQSSSSSAPPSSGGHVASNQNYQHGQYQGQGYR